MAAEAMRALQAGDLLAARTGFRRVLDEDIEHPDALHGMGLFARQVGQLETAADLIRKAIRANPRGAGYWSNLGIVLQELERWDEAAEAHAQALRLRPDHAGVRLNLGCALDALGRSLEAVPHLREALRLSPGSAEIAANYATVLSRIGEAGSADRYFRQALAEAPDNATTRFNYATHLLASGRWKEGWELYASRLQAPAWRSSRRPLPVTEDLPDRLSGCRVFLHREQGIGDEIRFATMVAELAERGAEVTLETTAKLHALLARSLPAVRVVAAPFAAAETGAERFDVIMPVGSLGRHLRAAADRFPRDGALLVPDAERAAGFRRRLCGLGPQPKVGIAWRSTLRTRLRSQFYALVSDLEPLLRLQGVTFVNLQYDDCRDELAEMRQRYGVDVHAFEDVDLFDDLDGAAALTSQLDFVVSANTSVAAIAGGLGVPAFEFHGRPVADGYTIAGTDPWFPSVTPLGKRIAEPWTRVMRTIARELGRRAAAGR